MHLRAQSVPLLGLLLFRFRGIAGVRFVVDGQGQQTSLVWVMSDVM